MISAEVFVPSCGLLTEGPVWDDVTSTLLWVDIDRGQIHRATEFGNLVDMEQFNEPVGFVALTDGTTLMAGTSSGIRRVNAEKGHPLVSALPQQPPGIRMNDGKADPQGHLIAGTMHIDEIPGAGSLWIFDGKQIQRLLNHTTISNGLAWSSDGETMYFIDSPTRSVDAFDYDLAHRRLSDRRRIATIDYGIPVPDGMTIDEEDHLWIALWGGSAVLRVNPLSGTVERAIQLPTPLVTSCTFGGPKLDHLFITTASRGRPDDPSAGHVYVARPGVKGTRAYRIAHLK